MRKSTYRAASVKKTPDGRVVTMNFYDDFGGNIHVRIDVAKFAEALEKKCRDNKDWTTALKSKSVLANFWIETD